MLPLIKGWAEKLKNRALADTAILYRYHCAPDDIPAKELKKFILRVARGDEDERFYQRMILLSFLLDHEDEELLRVLIEDFPEDVLYKFPFSIIGYLTFRQLGKDDEIELLTEDLMDGLQRYWMDAWSEKNPRKLQNAVAAYWLVKHKEGKAVPFWLKEIPQHMSRLIDRVRGELMLLMTEGKWDEFESLVKKHHDAFEKPEARVLKVCGALGQKRTGSKELARKVLLSYDKMDSFAFYLREMLRQ